MSVGIAAYTAFKSAIDHAADGVPDASGKVPTKSSSSGETSSRHIRIDWRVSSEDVMGRIRESKALKVLEEAKEEEKYHVGVEADELEASPLSRSCHDVVIARDKKVARDFSTTSFDCVYLSQQRGTV